MGQVKEINIKNRSYYFCDDMINIKNFHSNLLTINKKSHNEIDIYNIGYIKIKKSSDCEKFPTLTIIIRCVLQKDEKLYPQIYFDECLYELPV